MTTPTVTERGRLTALRAAWLFDGTGSTLIPDPLVVIDGGTIVAVGSGAPAPDGADVVDLGGAALLPGLVDTHVHLAFDASMDPVAALAARSDEETIEAMTRAGQAALAGGVTTVRDLGDRDYLSLGLRGRPGLPTILAAGPPVTTPTGHCHYLGGAAEPTEAGVRAAVREPAGRGCRSSRPTRDGCTRPEPCWSRAATPASPRSSRTMWSGTRRTSCARSESGRPRRCGCSPPWRPR